MQYGKENHHENGYRDPKQISTKSVGLPGDRTDVKGDGPGYSLYSEDELAKAEARLKPDRPADVSITSTTSSERKIIKRKVLR